MMNISTVTKHDFNYHEMVDNTVELHVKHNNVRFAISFNLDETSFDEGMIIAIAKVKDEYINQININANFDLPPS